MRDGGREDLSATTVAAITAGAPTTGDLGVAALLEGGTLVCTATLVSPRVLLTAAHCLPDGSTPVAFFGSAPQSGGITIPVIATARHPHFDAATLANDVAMALLGEAAPAGATPWPLPTAPLDPSSVGLPLRIVGFGATGPSDTSPPQKRTGTTTIASLSAETLTFDASPSQTCTGDSGGPAFATIGGVETLVGVTSSGDAQCDASARDVRVDAVASFIAPWLQATAEGAAGPGDRCWYAANCASGAGGCVAALDDVALSFCAPPCGAGQACPAGLSCLAGSDGTMLCRHAPPSPGAPGAACSADGECEGSSCLAPASGGAPVCAATCFPDLPGFCSDGTQCLAAAGDAGSACFAPGPPSPSPSPGGCCIAPAAASSAGPAALALVAALALISRRRGACAGARSRTDRGAP